MPASVTVTKPRRRARRGRRARNVNTSAGIGDVAPRARHGVATAPPRQPTGWHGHWSALDDRLSGSEERPGRQRLVIKPVHALVVVLLAAFALACFAIVNRGGDTLDQLDGAAVTFASSDLQVDLSPGQ